MKEMIVFRKRLNEKTLGVHRFLEDSDWYNEFAGKADNLSAEAKTLFSAFLWTYENLFETTILFLRSGIGISTKIPSPSSFLDNATTPKVTNTSHIRKQLSTF